MLHQQLPRMYPPRLPRQGPDRLHRGAGMHLVTLRRVRPLTRAQRLNVLLERVEYA